MTSETIVSNDQDRIEYIALDQISPHPDNERPLEVDDPAIQELAESIREQGLLQPALIAQAPAGLVPTPYVVVFGHRRWMATRLAGLPTLRTTVARGWSSQQIDEAQIAENLKREDLPPVAEARRLDHYIRKNELSVRDAARRLGKSPSWVVKRRALLDLPEDVQALVDADEISKPAAYELARLAKLATAQEEEGQRRAVLEALRGVVAETRGQDSIVVRDAVDRAVAELSVESQEEERSRGGRRRAEQETAHQAARRQHQRRPYVKPEQRATMNPSVTVPGPLYVAAVRRYGRFNMRAQLSALLTAALERDLAARAEAAEAEQELQAVS